MRTQHRQTFHLLKKSASSCNPRFNFMKKILLLDVDGTLIHDRGYRHAMVAAAQHVCRRRALPTHAPTDHEINVMHACGFSNEWDSVPFTVGINLLLAANGDDARPDFAAWASKTKDFAGLPNERARDALKHEAPAAIHNDLHALLDEVKDPHTSETTRLLYNFVLGSPRFEQHYGVSSDVQTDSMLERMDVPLIDERSREVIYAHASAIYTARPSLPPEGNAGLYQTPEAEIAMVQLHLDPQRVPVMGLGPMQWLVDRCGGGMWDYAKPALVQPIAAMLAASGTPVKDATLAAYDAMKQNVAHPSLRTLDGTTVIVFEDNAGGVRAAKDAAQVLAHHDVHVNVIGYGIAKDDAKRQSKAS
jgi:hypothetical protein